MSGFVSSVTRQLQSACTQPAAPDSLGPGRGVEGQGQEDQEVQQGADPGHDPGQRGLQQGPSYCQHRKM